MDGITLKGQEMRETADLLNNACKFLNELLQLLPDLSNNILTNEEQVYISKAVKEFDFISNNLYIRAENEVFEINVVENKNYVSVNFNFPLSKEQDLGEED